MAKGYLTGLGVGLGLLAAVGSTSCVSVIRDSSGTVRTFSTHGQGMRVNGNAAEIDSAPPTIIAPGYYNGGYFNYYPYSTWSNPYPPINGFGPKYGFHR